MIVKIARALAVKKPAARGAENALAALCVGTVGMRLGAVEY